MSKGIKFYSIMLILFGVYNLLGLVDRSQFSILFKDLSVFLVNVFYGFMVFYGICCCYCGMLLLKLENWARKLLIWMVSVSVIIGLFSNRMAIANLKVYLASEQSVVPPDMVGATYNYAITLTAVMTLFELSFIFFFTRPKVVKQFKVGR